jgi:HEAT repeat protein
MSRRIPILVLATSIVTGAMLCCGPPPEPAEPDEAPAEAAEEKTYKHCPVEQWGWGAEYEAKIVGVITDSECNPSDRKEAVSRAGQMRINDAVAPLFSIVTDEGEDEALRIEAISAIGNFGTRKVLRPFEELLEDPNPQISTAAAKALAQLAQMGDRYAVHLMKGLAASKQEDALKTIAVVALGRSGKFSVADDLIVLLENEQPTIRADAAEALGVLGDLNAVEPLVALLEDEDKTVRTKACQALGQIGDPTASDALLKVARDDSDRYVRSDAAYALGLIADENALDELVSILKEADESDRWAYQSAVGQYGNLAFDTAVELLDSDKKALRQVAVNILSRIRDTRAREHLVEALDDSSEEVRQNVAYSLGQYGGDEIASKVLERYDDEKSENVRSALLQAMGRMGDDEFEKVLIEASREEVSRLKAEAVRSLGSYHSEASLEAVIAAVSSESEWVREAAAFTLGTMHAPEGVEPLVGLLEDDHAWVRMSALDTLGRLGDRSVVDEIIELSDDKDERVRQAVLRSLGELGGEKAMEAIIAALDDDKEVVREQAIRSLGRIMTEREVPDYKPFFVAFTKGLSDEDYYVRREAASRLAAIRVPFPEGVQKGLIQALDVVDDYAFQDIVWALSRVDDKGVADKMLEIVEASAYGVDLSIEQAVASMDDELVEQRLVELAGSDDALTRATASLALAYLGSDEAQGILVGQLDSDVAFTRQVAADALGVIGDAEASPALADLLDDPDEDVVLAAVSSLGQVGRRHDGSVDVDRLLALLEGDDPHLRSEVAAALGYIGDPQARPKLLELFEQDARRLKSLGCGIRCGVVAQYGFALRLLGGSEETTEALLEMIDNPHPRTRGEAARVLAAMADEDAVKELIEAVQEESDLVIRDSLIDALGMTGSRKAVPVLKKLLDDADNYTIAVVIDALGRTGGAKEAKLVEGYLDHHNMSVVGAAVRALGRLGSKRSADEIAAMVGDDRYPWLQQTVYEALVRIGDVKAAQEPLEAVVRDSDRKSEVIMAGLAAAALRIEPLRAVFEKRIAKFGIGGKLKDIVDYLYGDEDKGNELFNWLMQMRIPRGNSMIADFVMVAFRFGGEKGRSYVETLRDEASSQFVSNSARSLLLYW